METITFTLNGDEAQAEKGQTLIDAIKGAGADVPHYCYHEALSVAGSCRLCAVEVGSLDKEGQVRMIPKVMMSCQMPVTQGMVVVTHSEKAKQHRREIMEFLLINHPLDCPVCDQAGECFLQDYSYGHGQAEGRFDEDKIKQPKKQVGEKILLYADRCIMCTCCVRFTREISGGAELMIHDRGNLSEIDVFPGIGVNDKMAGNVVDICPVGALLSTEFLFKQRVWDLTSTESICPGCSRGCNISIDHNQGVIYRLRPRYNAAVNGHWMCDEGRHGFKFVHADQRLRQSQVRQAGTLSGAAAAEAIQAARDLLEPFEEPANGGKLAVVISPAASVEEQWLLGQWARQIGDDVALVSGPVFSQGEDETFKGGFVIKAEKSPNRQGMAQVLKHLGGRQMAFADLAEAAGAGEVDAILLQGGYPWQNWCPQEVVAKLRQAQVLLVLDILESDLTLCADVALAGAAWAEKAGSFINDEEICQAFAPALEPPGEAGNDLDILWRVIGRQGEPDLQEVRREMADRGQASGARVEDPIGV